MSENKKKAEIQIIKLCSCKGSGLQYWNIISNVGIKKLCDGLLSFLFIILLISLFIKNGEYVNVLEV